MEYGKFVYGVENSITYFYSWLVMRNYCLCSSLDHSFSEDLENKWSWIKRYLQQ